MEISSGSPWYSGTVYEKNKWGFISSYNLVSWHLFFFKHILTVDLFRHQLVWKLISQNLNDLLTLEEEKMRFDRRFSPHIVVFSCGLWSQAIFSKHRHEKFLVVNNECGYMHTEVRVTKTKQEERWNAICLILQLFTSYLFEFLCVSSHEYHRPTCRHGHGDFIPEDWRWRTSNFRLSKDQSNASKTAQQVTGKCVTLTSIYRQIRTRFFCTGASSNAVRPETSASCHVE